MNKYSEHDKLLPIKNSAQIIGEFIDWMREEKKWDIFRYNNYYADYDRLNMSIEKILAEYFDIDLNKIEEEKREMLEELRVMHDKS